MYTSVLTHTSVRKYLHKDPLVHVYTRMNTEYMRCCMLHTNRQVHANLHVDLNPIDPKPLNPLNPKPLNPKPRTLNFRPQASPA